MTRVYWLWILHQEGKEVMIDKREESLFDIPEKGRVV